MLQNEKATKIRDYKKLLVLINSRITGRFITVLKNTAVKPCGVFVYIF